MWLGIVLVGGGVRSASEEEVRGVFGARTCVDCGNAFSYSALMLVLGWSNVQGCGNLVDNVLRRDRTRGIGSLWDIGHSTGYLFVGGRGGISDVILEGSLCGSGGLSGSSSLPSSLRPLFLMDTAWRCRQARTIAANQGEVEGTRGIIREDEKGGFVTRRGRRHCECCTMSECA